LLVLSSFIAFKTQLLENKRCCRRGSVASWNLPSDFE
jgi:hypothetical protein